MNWDFVKPLKSADEIKNFEVKYGFEFPDDFKKTASEFNGAYPELWVFDTAKTKERTIKSLLSFNKDDAMSVWEAAENCAEAFGGKYVAFAIDEFGNFICFSAEDKSVVFFDMETLKAEPAADSFSAFLDKLYTI